MSCCGLFRSKQKAKAATSDPIVATMETERSVAQRSSVQRKTAPQRLPFTEVSQSTRLVTQEDRKDMVAEANGDTKKANYCLNVPWRNSSTVDRTKATPFHLYSPGDKPRF